MGEPIEERGCHLGIAEDTVPFAEGQVVCDDDRGPFIQLVRMARAQLIQDQEVEARYEVCGSALSPRYDLDLLADWTSKAEFLRAKDFE